MRYCIAYIANNEVQEFFKEITEELGIKFAVANLSKRVPAHITLVYPFESDNCAAIELQLEKVSQSIKPVSFTIGGFERFTDNKKTIFMKVEGSDAFYESVKSCIVSIGTFDEDRKFDLHDRKFHISIVRNLNPEISDAVTAYLENQSIPHFDSIFNNIALLEFRNDIWKIKRVFNF